MKATSTTPFGLVDDSSTAPTVTGSSGIVNGIDWMAQQNGGRFDPVLFGDYREPQEAITSGDYGFFSDAFPTYNFSTSLTATNDFTPPSSATTTTRKSVSGVVSPPIMTTEKQHSQQQQPAAAVSAQASASAHAVTSASFAPGSRLSPEEEAKFAVDCTKLWYVKTMHP